MNLKAEFYIALMLFILYFEKNAADGTTENEICDLPKIFCESSADFEWNCTLPSPTDSNTSLHCTSRSVSSTDQLFVCRGQLFALLFNILFHLPTNNQTVKTVKLTICTPTTTAFRKAVKWKLEKNEITVDPNYTISYNPIHGDPICSTDNKSYYHNVLGEYKFNWKDESVYVRLPVCLFPPSEYLDIIIVISSILSCVALGIAMIMDVLLPSKSYDKRPLTCHMLSFFIGYVGLIIRFFTEKPYGVMCYVISLSVNYFFQTGVTWMSVIIFYMWRQLHRDRILTHTFHKSNKTFALQSLFAWGVPTVHLALVYPAKYLNHKTEDEDCKYLFRSNTVQVLLFYLPTEIIQVANFILFIVIGWNVAHFDEKANPAKSLTCRKLRRVMTKLMVVTGVCSLVGIPLWIFQDSNVINPYIVLFLNAIVFLQGFWLFLAYYGNLKVWKKLWTRKKKPVSEISTLGTFQRDKLQ